MQILFVLFSLCSFVALMVDRCHKRKSEKKSDEHNQVWRGLTDLPTVASILALVLYHAVDALVGIFPVTCLYLSVEASKHLVHVLPMLRTHCLWKRVGGCIPCSLSVGAQVGEHPQCPSAVQFFHEHLSLCVAIEQWFPRPVVVEENES